MITHETPVPELLALLEGNRDGWPRDWPHWQNTREAYRQAFAEVCRASAPAPRMDGRAILTCGGGWRFLAGVYTLARVVRHLGCEFPIEVWHIGEHEFDPRFAAVTRGLGVTWRDALAVCHAKGIRRHCLQGWELKAFAVRHTDYRQVVFMDADCYPCRNPADLFDCPEFREAGAMFWPDYGAARNGGPLEPDQWHRYGLPDRREPDFESGQMVIDRGRAWRAVCAADWLNDHSWYVYKTGIYGDKSTWHLAWRATDTPYWMAEPVTWSDVAFLQRGPDGETFFIHRCRDKPRLPDQDFHYQTKQRHQLHMVRSNLPLEDFVHAAVKECHQLLHPPEGASWRPQTDDLETFHESCLCNIYEVPERFEATDVVIDVGAHIGFFARLCLDRGAGKVYAVEPWRDNLGLLMQNVGALPGAVYCPFALWSRAGEIEFLPPTLAGRTTYGLCRSEDSPAVCPEHAGLFGPPVTVPALTLDYLIGKQKIRFLKLDCEGAEFEILAASEALRQVEEIGGEYHGAAMVGDLQALLKMRGFSFSSYANPKAPDQGIFHARRIGAAGAPVAEVAAAAAASLR